MSTPPITQKNALLALASAASNAAAVSALVTQPEQLCSSGVRTCISANPPPVTGWIRCWVGKASTPPMMRRTLLKEDVPTKTVLGIATSASTGLTKKACTNDVQRDVRSPVISEWPPRMGGDV